METRAITFRKLKHNCCFDFCHADLGDGRYCFYNAVPTTPYKLQNLVKCNSKNCPVWRKLKVIK